MKQQLTSFLLLISIISLGKNYQQYVNPFIGTDGHGHTFPGATVPFGMVQLLPDTRIDGSWDGCSGYHYSDNLIYGFLYTHLNGTGVSDYGDIMLMPTMGEPSFDNKMYSSTFSHANEKGLANIILDLNHRDKLLEGEVRIIDEKRIWVKRRSKAFPVIKDLVVDRSSFDRIQQAGGFVSVNTSGNTIDTNATPIPKDDTDKAFEAAACIGCGACVASFKYGSSNGRRRIWKLYQYWCL